MRGGEGDGFLQSVEQTFLGLTGDAHHEIQIDIVKSRFPGGRYRAANIFPRVYPSQRLKLIGMRTLCAHAEAVGTLLPP